jgi:hypothetical protein
LKNKIGDPFMKKDFFIFNSKALIPFFEKKALLTILPIKFLIRLKTTELFLVDAFSFFFYMKLQKAKDSFFIKKLNTNIYETVSTKSQLHQRFFFKGRMVGNYLSITNFKFSFSFYKP